MKKKILVFVIIVLCGFTMNDMIINGKKNTIYIDVIDEYYLPNKLYEWDTVKFNNGAVGYIYLQDFRGNMFMKVIKNKKVFCSGKYVNSLDTLKHYVEVYDDAGVAKIKVEKYFQPLKDSVWSFYDYKLKKNIKKIYNNGIH